jgi:hypothetical protein
MHDFLLLIAQTTKKSHSPQNREELFNLRHAQARNIIERIFGVIKKRWRILIMPPSYDMKVQARIPAALAALHNFILEHDPDDRVDPEVVQARHRVRWLGAVEEG